MSKSSKLEWMGLCDNICQILSVRDLVSIITYQCQHHILTHIAMYHVLKATIAIIRHVMVVTRHEATKEKCSPKIK